MALRGFLTGNQTEYAEIELGVTHNKLSLIHGWKGTKGCVKSIFVSFEFRTEDWNSLAKTIVFRGGETSIDVVADATNKVAIPPEMLAIDIGNAIEVSVYGSNGDGVILCSDWLQLFHIEDGADPSGDESTDPTLPVWAQLQSQIGDLADLTTEDKATLVGAINEAAESGGGSGASTWSDLTDKPFESIGDGLSVTDGKLTAEVTAAELAAKQDKGDYATESDLSEHTSDADIHVTAAQKAEWSGKQPAGDYATTAALTTHTGDSTIHVTASDKTRWDGKQDAGDYATESDLSKHTSDADIHVTAAQKAEWSGKQDAGDYATKTELVDHTSDTTIHVTASDKTRWDGKQDKGDYAKAADIPTKTSELTNDSGYLTDIPTASATVLGGVKVGDGLAINDGVLSVSIAAATGVTF